MELVDGEELAQRIARGPIPLDEALPIARQIAEALEAAHEQGIVHRDLKPANIKIRDDGTVKVLDFGLAKALEPPSAVNVDVAASPTITTPAMMTGAGVILGTAAYMSPEQAKGRAADKRSDIWAFGCVLYEMLSGRRPFAEEDVADTLAAVLRAEPDWSRLPADTPALLRTLIAGCLVKDRRHRIADLAVAQFVLAEAGAPVSRGASPAVAAPAAGPRWRSWLAVAVLVTAALAATAAWRLRPSPIAAPVARFSFALPEREQTSIISRHGLAISPDGTQIVYVADSRLVLRKLSELDAHPIPGAESPVPIVDPVFSPDGRTVAFYSQVERAVRSIAVGGGPTATLCSTNGTYGLTWDVSGILIGVGPQGVLRCSLAGGAPERLVTVDRGQLAQQPQMLPGGQAVLFTMAKSSDGPARWDKAQVIVQTIATGARKTIVTGGSDARYVQSGHVLYAASGVVMAVPFDASRQMVTGGSVPVVEGVRRAGPSGSMQFDVSASGTLIYVPGPARAASAEHAIAVSDRAGQQMRTLVPPGPYTHVRASRDGARVAVGSDDGREANVWIYALNGTGPMRRLTLDGQNRFPIWSPDGQRVAFQSDREGGMGIFSQRADGTGPVERLTKAAPGDAHVPESWSPDGKHIAISEQKGAVFSLRILSMEDHTSVPYGGVESTEPIGAVFSPDGKWIAYSAVPPGASPASLRSGERGVYLQSFPATKARYQLPKQGIDFHPVWGPKGTELIFVPTAASGLLAVVPVTLQPSVTFGTPSSVPLRLSGDRISTDTRAFDILPDGSFIGLASPSEADSAGSILVPQIRVVLNWFDELKARAPIR
jgi:serine/threonine-protein kinase